MKKLSILPIVALAGIAGLGGTSHADGIGSAVGDCSSVTFTTAAGTRMILGVDSEPPVEINDGATAHINLFPYFPEHTWTFVVLENGAIVDRGLGHVDGCAALEYPADPGYDTIGSKVAGTPAAAVEAVIPVVHEPEFRSRFGPS